MPVTASWHDSEQTITRVDFVNGFTMNEIFDAWLAELDATLSVDRPVYSLNVFADDAMIVGGFSMTKILAFIRANRAPNLQLTVQVAGSAAIRRILTGIAAVMPHEVHIVATEDEAYAIISEHEAAETQKKTLA